jgi:hypothetical protein
MAMETAAAILTKLAVEQNTDLRSRLNSAHGQTNVIALIMPVFRQILSELQEDRHAHEKFPSAVPHASSSPSVHVAPPDLDNATNFHIEEHLSEEDDIGGEG